MFKDTKSKLGTLSIIMLMFLIVVVPSFSKLKTLETFNDLVEWDGSVASSFKSGDGSLENPYIISDAKELAYFSDSLRIYDYEGKYVKLSSDIILNKGIFERDGLKYIYNNNEYYIYGAKYYLTSEFNSEVGTLNILDTLDNFKGTFNGDYHTIFGLYLFGDDKALFTNLSGTLENLYIENSVITNGYAQAGVVLNANNASISNIVFDGSIINNNEYNEVNINKNVDDITVVDSTNIEFDKPTTSNYTATLSGECTGLETFNINGSDVACSSFSVNVNPFNTNITSSSEITLTNLTYELTYDKSISAGIIGSAINTSISNVVNKGYVSNYNSAGVAGIIYNSNIVNSYNKGTINGVNVSGLVNTIYNTNNVNISNNFNIGSLNGTNNSGLISNVVDSNIVIDSSFNIVDVDPVGTNANSNITVNNSYNKKFNNKFTLKEEDINSRFNDSNTWVIRRYPILKFDSIKDNIAQVKIGDDMYYSLNNVSDIYKDEEISILLTSSNDYKPVKEAYYYISNTILSDEELNNVNWTVYENGFNISDENVYVVYFKLVDYNNNDYYINTNRYIIDYTPSNAMILLGNYRYDEEKIPSNIYIKDNLSLEILTNSNVSNVDSVEYFISSEVLNNIESNTDITWNTYSKALIINNNNPYIVYVRVNNNNTYNYINSDYIVPKYFNISNIKSGANLQFNSNMSYNSAFNFNVSLSHSNLTNDFNRYIKVNKELPNNTNIILKDLVNNKIYSYTVNSLNNTTLYDLTAFSEVGNVNDVKFTNDSLNNVNEELFNIYVSFENINEIEDSYTFELVASNDNNTIYSLDNVSVNLKDVDTNLNDYLSISTKKKELNVTYNTKGSVSIPLTLGVNESGVINTNLENLNRGLKIELLDENDNIVSRDNYKTIKFEVDGSYYYPSKDNITYIQTVSLNPTLVVHTSEDRDAQNLSNYKFKVSAYLSIGNKVKYESNNEIYLPLSYKSKYLNNNYNFDVNVNNSLIINTQTNNNISFTIKGKGKLNNPNIRLSLYKKKELTAYNQEYQLVDLKDYVNEEYISVDDNVYKVFDNLEYFLSEYSTNTLNLSFKDIEINGYKFLFELYDGNNLVGKKYISVIVR